MATKMRELDYLGIFLLLPGITVFIMAVEFGIDNWNEARTIGCFAAAGTLLLSFMAQSGGLVIGHLCYCAS